MTETGTYVRWLEDVTGEDVSIVGGRNASLGEMIQSLQEEGVRMPGGFATLPDAYREFPRSNVLDDKIEKQLDELDKQDSKA